MRIAIITGVEEEAEAFAPGQHERVEQHGHLSVRFLDHAGHAVAICCCGVGKVNAAIAATMLATVHRAELLMIIGTAGKLSGIAGDCFIIHEAVQGDYGAQRPDGFTHYTAGSWPIGPASVEHFRAHPLPDIGLPHARIVTGDAFIECPDHSLRLREGLGGDLVDMETGALAQVAVRLGLPWSAIKATTDEANGTSAGDFQTNLLLAARRAAEAAERSLARLG
ncbi:MAG: purine phosphorylase [Sphingobium sp.]